MYVWVLPVCYCIKFIVLFKSLVREKLCTGVRLAFASDWPLHFVGLHESVGF